MTDYHAALMEWLRAEFEAEQNSGFARLKRVPDTQVIRFLDHFASLDSAGQAELVAILVEWAAYNLPGTVPNPSYERYANATAFPGLSGGLRYTGVNLLAGLAKETGNGGLPGYFQMQGVKGLALELPQNLVAVSTDLVPVRIPTLRRIINSTFAKLFAPQLTAIGSETWCYEGVLNGSRLKLHIRFSGRMGCPQLRYSAEVHCKGHSIVSPNLCFETVLGAGFGCWDYLTMENAEPSVALLAELIEWLAELPARLPQACYQPPSE